MLAGRALRVQRAAVDVDVNQRRGVAGPVELVRPGGDVGVLVGRELEHGDVDALALGARAAAGRVVERVLLRWRQAAATGARAVTKVQRLAADDVVEQLLGGGVGRLAVVLRGRLGVVRAERGVDAGVGGLGVADRVGQADHAERGTRDAGGQVDGRGVGEVLGALRVLEHTQRSVERVRYLSAGAGSSDQERRARRYDLQAAVAQELGHRLLSRRRGRVTGVELAGGQPVVVKAAVLVIQRAELGVHPSFVTRGNGHLDLHVRVRVAAGDGVGR